MIVFFITVLAVAALLTLDRIYSNKPKEPIKYSNLDWEVGDSYPYCGRIYSVVKNKVVTVYLSKPFEKKADAEKHIKKIYPAMCIEYGLSYTPSPNRDSNRTHIDQSSCILNSDIDWRQDQLL